MQTMDIVLKLKTYRLKNKIPQQKLADTLGVAFSTVNRWFNGKAKPNEIQLYHIGELLKGRLKHGSKNKKITKDT